MTLLDDTFDCCGRRFDPMGDPYIYKPDPRNQPMTVWCATCSEKALREKKRAKVLDAIVTHRVGEDQHPCPQCLSFYGGVVDKVLEVLDG